MPGEEHPDTSEDGHLASTYRDRAMEEAEHWRWW